MSLCAVIMTCLIFAKIHAKAIFSGSQRIGSYSSPPLPLPSPLPRAFTLANLAAVLGTNLQDKCFLKKSRSTSTNPYPKRAIRGYTLFVLQHVLMLICFHIHHALKLQFCYNHREY